MKARASGIAASTGSCPSSLASAWKSRSARAREVLATARTRSTVSRSACALVCAQRFTQELSEESNILAQWFVRIGLHLAPTISIEEDGTVCARHFCRDLLDFRQVCA